MSIRFDNIWAGLAVVTAAAVGTFAACGGDLTIGGFPEIAVIVDNQEATSATAVSVAFPSAVQSTVNKSVQIINPGNRALTIESIDWDGPKNSYVEIDWKNAVSTFPVTLEGYDSVGLNFDIVFSPPFGAPLDDFSKSVLLIQSDGRSSKGEELVPEIRVTFTVPEKSAWPEVSPDNAILSGTPVSPDSLEFCVQSNADLGNASFQVEGIALETTSNEFFLDVVDNLPATVHEQSAPAYREHGQFDCKGVRFKITYHPVNYEDDENRVFVYTDSADPLIVSLTGELSETSVYEITYGHAQEFDFSNEIDNTAKTRTMLLTSLGPGAVTVDEPSIEPADAAQFFSWTAFKPATSPDAEDIPIDGVSKKFPQALTSGNSVRFEVTYTPKVGIEPPNGQLVIPVKTPDPGEARIDLFAGTAKAKIAVAPVTKNVTVTTQIGEGDGGERHVVIYNHGNGDLDVSELAITNVVASIPADNWTLTAGPATPFTLGPEEIEVLTVAWDGLNVTDPDGESETLSITYFDAFVGEEVAETVALVVLPAGGGTNPTGALTPVEGAAAGEPMIVSAAQSEPGSYELTSGSFIWYLLDKPAGSSLRLNDEGDAAITVIPDVAGTYTFEVVPVSFGGAGEFLVGTAASLDVVVGDAPAD